VAQEKMGKVHLPGMRRHVRTFRHKAHVAKRAGFGDLGKILGLHAFDVFARIVVDQFEETREGIAKIEAAPAAMTDLEDPAHLGVELGGIVKFLVSPCDRMASWASRLPSRDMTDKRIQFDKSRKGGGSGSKRADPRFRKFSLFETYLSSAARAFWNRPAWLFSAFAKSRTSRRFVEAFLARGPRHARYMSVYSWVSPAIAEARFLSVGPIGFPVAGSQPLRGIPDGRGRAGLAFRGGAENDGHINCSLLHRLLRKIEIAADWPGIRRRRRLFKLFSVLLPWRDAMGFSFA